MWSFPRLGGCEVVCPSRWVRVCAASVCVFTARCHNVSQKLWLCRARGFVCDYARRGASARISMQPATVRHAVFPNPPNTRLRRRKAGRCFILMLSYIDYSPFHPFLSLILLVKRKPQWVWEGDTFLHPPPVDYILWISGKANDHVL